MTQLARKPRERDVAAEVAALALRHGVTYQPADTDALARHISRLSDAEVEPDDTEDLLIALTRAGVISEARSVELHGAYLRQLGYR